MNVKVEIFSWGYGKRLFGLKKGDTDYRVSIIPMGGYVKFSGDEVLDLEKPLAPHDFLAKKRWERFFVIFLGPVMNIVLAVFLFSIINMVGVSVPEYLDKKPVIGWMEKGGPAERAGLLANDTILSVNNRTTKTWRDVEIAVGTKPNRLISIEIERKGKKETIELKTEKKTKYARGYAGFFANISTQIDAVTSNSPAEKAGLEPGDIILAVNNEPIFYFEGLIVTSQFVEIIKENPEKELQFSIRRGEEIRTFNITPQRKEDVGMIGIYPGPKSIDKKFGFFSAIGQGAKDSWDITFFVINFIKDLVTGKASAKQLGGPIAIANISYTAFRMGFLPLLQFIAFISLQLGILNLFPIPVLDGGHLLVLGLEGIFRRDFSVKIKQVVMQIGFVFFILLIVFAVLNDIARILPNGWKSLIPF